jgi:hypothetical protein
VKLLPFLVLSALRAVARLFWRVEMTWVGRLPPGDPWDGLRVVAVLNHTSLYEPIFAGGAPVRFLRRLAEHGVIPVAQKTLARPLIGHFFRSLAPHVVPLTRQRDQTWRQVLAKVDDPKAMVAMLPEGRMKRANGLDADGRPMTVRAGIADILLAVPDGRLLLAYSEGLHHVQAPGERFPRLFQRVRMRLEVVEIAAYRAELLARHGEEGFIPAVIADLTRRRDLYCAPAGWEERVVAWSADPLAGAAGLQG